MTKAVENVNAKKMTNQQIRTDSFVLARNTRSVVPAMPKPQRWIRDSLSATWGIQAPSTQRPRRAQSHKARASIITKEMIYERYEMGGYRRIVEPQRHS